MQSFTHQCALFLSGLAGMTALACEVERKARTPIEVTRSALGAGLGEDATPTGFAIDEDSGQRYLLDPELGILEIDEAGNAKSIWSPTEDLPRLTDLCAMGGGRFIAAADGDGYVIDVASGAARQHFCLEPGWDPSFDPEPDVPLKHLNRSVACDVAAGLIYGQPQTVPRDGLATPLRSELASYRLSTGADVEWVPLPDAAYHAGGMTVVRTGLLLLGAGSSLSLFDADSGTLTSIADLATEGVGRIEALSIDRETDTVVLLDGADNTLVTVPLDALGF